MYVKIVLKLQDWGIVEVWRLRTSGWSFAIHVLVHAFSPLSSFFICFFCFHCPVVWTNIRAVRKKALLVWWSVPAFGRGGYTGTVSQKEKEEGRQKASTHWILLCTESDLCVKPRISSVWFLLSFIFILYVLKLEPRRVKWFACSHTAVKWRPRVQIPLRIKNTLPSLSLFTMQTTSDLILLRQMALKYAQEKLRCIHK